MSSNKSMKIILYSSQLASFIGRNVHTNPNKIFNKLYENNFGGIIKNMGLDGELKNSIIGDGSTIDNICSKLENNRDLRKKLDNICQRNLSTIGVKREAAELERQVMEEKGLNENDKVLLKKAMDGYTNKKYGTIREVNALDIYKEKMNCDVVTKIDSRCKKICEYRGIELILISKIDAITMDGVVVEIKNRMYKLFNEVREYEWLQVQAYLEVYNLEKGELVEYLKVGDGEMSVKEIMRDRRFWNEIVLREVGYYFRTMINLISDEKKIKKYLILSDTEQNEFIKKMVRKEAKEN